MSTADSRPPSSGGRKRENHSGATLSSRTASSSIQAGRATVPAPSVGEGSMEPDLPAYAIRLTTSGHFGASSYLRSFAALSGSVSPVP